MENFPLVNNLDLINVNDRLRSALDCISFHCSGTFLFLKYLPLSSPDKFYSLESGTEKEHEWEKWGNLNKICSLVNSIRSVLLYHF